MTLLAGIDFSSKAIHAAIIPLDPTAAGLPAVTLRTAELPRDADPSQRCRGVRTLLTPFWMVGYEHTPTWADTAEVTSVWIEEPFGRFRTADRVLLPLLGAILASIPTGISATTIGVQEWRRELGLPAKITKPAGIAAAAGYLPRPSQPRMNEPMNEHHAEALLIAHAGRQITWRHHDKESA